MLLVITENDIAIRESNKDRSIDDIHNYLWAPVELEGSVTLRRLFGIIEPLVDFWGIMLNENVSALVTEMATSCVEPANFSSLVVSWQLERQKGELTLTNDFSGKDVNNVFCAVEFYPVNRLGAIPVKIQKELALFDWDTQETQPLGVRQPSLIEMYKAIFYELSFFGSPEEREAAKLELEQALDDVEHSRISEVLFEEGV